MIDALDVNKGLNQSAFKDIINKTLWIRGQNDQILKAITYQYTNWDDIDNVNATRQSFLDIHADVAYKAPAILSAMIFARQNVDTYFYQVSGKPMCLVVMAAIVKNVSVFLSFFSFSLTIVQAPIATTGQSLNGNESTMALMSITCLELP